MPGGLLDSGDSGDALYVVNHYQRIVRWNAGAERLLAYAAGEVLNKPCHEVIAGCGRDGKPICSPNCPTRRTVERGELPCGHEFNVRTGDGRRIWLHLAVIVVPQQLGPLMLHLLRDVSAARYATEAMAEVASLCHLHRLHAGQDDQRHAGAEGAAETAQAALTPRQREIVRLLAKGMSNSSIALSLGVSVHTVRNHVQHILAKLPARNRAEAVSLVLRSHLV